MKTRAQITTEFIFAIGTIFFVFIIMMVFMFDRNQELRDSEKQISERNTCLMVSNLITSAFIGGEGTKIEEVVIDHDITISEDYSQLYVGEVSCWLSVHNLPSGQIDKGTIKIENTNNEINIQNV